jgi:hypothetical protein
MLRGDTFAALRRTSSASSAAFSGAATGMTTIAARLRLPFLRPLSPSRRPVYSPISSGRCMWAYWCTERKAQICGNVQMVSARGAGVELAAE